MAVVAGALAVLLGVGSAGQAADLAFFGKESSTEESTATPDEDPADNYTPETAPTPSGTASAAAATPGKSLASNASANPGGGEALSASPAADPARGIDAIAGLPGGVTLPVPVGSPTAPAAAPVPGTPAASVTAPPSPSTPAATPSAVASPSATPSPTATSSATPTATSTPSAAETEGAEAYASSRLASYGWGANQMQALIVLWGHPSNWRTAKIDSSLNYIKERYGSPADALEVGKALKSY